MSNKPTNEESTKPNLELTFKSKTFSNDSSATTSQDDNSPRVRTIRSGSSTLSPKIKRFKMSTAVHAHPQIPLILPSNYSFENIRKTSDEHFDLQSHLNLLSIDNHENDVVVNNHNLSKKKNDRHRKYLSTISNIDEIEENSVFTDNASKHITFKDISDRHMRYANANVNMPEDTKANDYEIQQPYYANKNTCSMENMNQCDLEQCRDNKITEITPRSIEIPPKRQCIRHAPTLACATNNVIDIGKDNKSSTWIMYSSSVHTINSRKDDISINSSVLNEPLQISAPIGPSIVLDRILPKDVVKPTNKFHATKVIRTVEDRRTSKDSASTSKAKHLPGKKFENYSSTIYMNNQMKKRSSSESNIHQGKPVFSSTIAADLKPPVQNDTLLDEMYSHVKPFHPGEELVEEMRKNDPLDVPENSDALKDFYAHIKSALPSLLESNDNNEMMIPQETTSADVINMIKLGKTRRTNESIKAKDEGKNRKQGISSEELVNRIPSEEILKAMKNYDKTKKISSNHIKEKHSKDVITAMSRFVQEETNHRKKEDMYSFNKESKESKLGAMFAPKGMTKKQMSTDMMGKNINKFPFMSSRRFTNDDLIGQISTHQQLVDEKVSKPESVEIFASELSNTNDEVLPLDTFPSQKSTENILKEIQKLLHRENKNEQVTIEGAETISESQNVTSETISIGTQSEWTFHPFQIPLESMHLSKTVKIEEKHSKVSAKPASRFPKIKEGYADLPKYSPDLKSPKDMSSADIIDLVKGDKYSTPAEKYYHLRNFSPAKRAIVAKTIFEEKEYEEHNKNIPGPLTNKDLILSRPSSSIVSPANSFKSVVNESVKSIATAEEIILLQNLSNADCNKLKLPPMKSFSQIDVSTSMVENEVLSKEPYIKKIIRKQNVPVQKNRTKNKYKAVSKWEHDIESSSYSPERKVVGRNDTQQLDQKLISAVDGNKVTFLPVDDRLKEKFNKERSKPENICCVSNMNTAVHMNDAYTNHIKPENKETSDSDSVHILQRPNKHLNDTHKKKLKRRVNKKVTSLSRLPIRSIKAPSTDSQSITSSKNVSPNRRMLPLNTYVSRKMRQSNDSPTDSLRSSSIQQSSRISSKSPSIYSKSPTYSKTSSRDSSYTTTSPSRSPTGFGVKKLAIPKKSNPEQLIVHKKIGSIVSIKKSTYMAKVNDTTKNQKHSPTRLTRPIKVSPRKKVAIKTTKKVVPVPNKEQKTKSVASKKLSTISEQSSLSSFNATHTKLFIRVPDEEHTGNTWLQVKKIKDDVGVRETLELGYKEDAKQTDASGSISSLKSKEDAETESNAARKLKLKHNNDIDDADQIEIITKSMETLSTREANLSIELSNTILNRKDSWTAKPVSEKTSLHKIITAKESQIKFLETNKQIPSSNLILQPISSRQVSQIPLKSESSTRGSEEMKIYGSKRLKSKKPTKKEITKMHEERNKKMQEHKKVKIQEHKEIKHTSTKVGSTEQQTETSKSHKEDLFSLTSLVNPGDELYAVDECLDCVTNFTDTMDDLTSTNYMQIECEPNLVLSLPSSIQDCQSPTRRTPLEPNIIILDEVKTSKGSPLSSRPSSIMKKYYDSPDLCSTGRTPTYIVSPCSTSNSPCTKKKNMKDYIKSFLHIEEKKAVKEEDLAYFPEETELKCINYSDFNMPLGEMDVLPDIASTKSLVLSIAEEVFKSNEDIITLEEKEDQEDEVPADFKKKIICERISFKDLALLSRKSQIEMKESVRMQEELYLRNKRDKMNIAKSRRKQIVDIKYYLSNSEKSEPIRSKDSMISGLLKKESHIDTPQRFASLSKESHMATPQRFSSLSKESQPQRVASLSKESHILTPQRFAPLSKESHMATPQRFSSLSKESQPQRFATLSKESHLATPERLASLNSFDEVAEPNESPDRSWKPEDDDSESNNSRKTCPKMWMCFEFFFPQRDPRYF